MGQEDPVSLTFIIYCEAVILSVVKDGRLKSGLSLWNTIRRKTAELRARLRPATTVN